MPVEAWALVGTAVLTMVMILVQIVGAALEGRVFWAFGPRDRDNPAGIFGGRCERALRNQLEVTAVFVPLALVVLTVTGPAPLSGHGAMVFLMARIAYAPLYWFGVPYVRSAAYLIGMIGLLMMTWSVVVRGLGA